MPSFPSAPIPPADYLERYLPEAFAEARPPEAAREVKIQLGVHLAGEGGGEWLLDLEQGRVSVRAGSREPAAFSYVQSVEDWRGALWEERGGLVGRGAAALFRPGAAEVEAASRLVGDGALPGLLDALGELRGLIRVVVTDPGGDWRVALQLGPGPIPDDPTTEVSVSAGDLDLMQAGELKPMEAFMAGRIRVTGDMTLMLQMQAAQMQGGRDRPGSGRGGPA